MESKEFLDIIRAYCRRLNLAAFLKNLVSALIVGASVSIVFQILSFVMPLYYVNIYMGIALLSAVVTAAVLSWIKRGSMEHAALVMDSFGFRERIITAYEQLKETGGLIELQRRDAMEQLKAYRERIRIPLWPDWKKTALAASLLAVMLILALMPSQMKDYARELHQIHQEAKDKEKEIEEVLEELQKLEASEQETLTPEQMAAMQEMMESLQSSIAEYQQASSVETLQAAGEKLKYKYADMSSQMSDMAKSIQSGAALKPMTAESMQAMADKLQEMSGTSSADGNSLAYNQNGDGQIDQNSQNSQDNGQNDQGNDQNGQGNGQNGQNSQGNGQNNQGNGQNGQNNGQNGQSGSGNGQDGKSGSGSGQDGQGSGKNGQGSGQDGKGRGTGSANISRDYVSIPNAIADSGNLTGNAVDHDNSEYFRDQNGLSWEGTHMPHEAVIGSYEQNAYEGIAAGRYPSGMENVIKEYFSSFN